MKICILADFKDGPWGGGNQFLKALKNEFIKQGSYEIDPTIADVILFNSHHKLKNVIRIKMKYPDKIFIHRVDGPMTYRGKTGVKLDKQIFRINSLIAEGTVFQSEWSRQENYNNGMHNNNFEIVIHNSPDPRIFFPLDKKQTYDGKRKIRLIATSWSSNPDKGFDVYHNLDNKLDFKKYEMTFIGQIDKPFKNINQIDPLPSFELAEKLRKHDIFVFASKIEACSNSLLEALHCGLPCVVRNCSSNPEILGENGEVFQDKEEIPIMLDKMINNYEEYQQQINLPDIHEIGKQYYSFFKRIHYEQIEKTYISKSFNMYIYILLLNIIFFDGN